MVHIEVTNWCPSSKNQEVLDKYLALVQDPGMPSAVKSFKIYSKAHRKGTQTKSYLEIEPGKLDEAFTDLAPLMAALAEIEGFTFEYGIALSLEEGIAAQQAQQG